MIVNLIRVTLAYRGGVEIPQGEYAADDPALHDMADYLVRMGHARIVGQIERAPVVELVDAVETPAIVDSPPPPKAAVPPPKPVSPIAHKNTSRRRRT